MMMTAQPNLEAVMSRPTPVSLRAHHSYRSWSTDWYDDKGHRRTKRFGKEGDVTRKEAQARYQNWLSAEWGEKEHVRNPSGTHATYTVRKLADDYEAHARTIYVKRGAVTSFISQVVSAMSKLRDTYGDFHACEVDGPMIARLRDQMIRSEPLDDKGTTRPLVRGTVNDRLHIVKQAFAWAHAERGTVSATVAWSISKVSPLKEGRSEAKEPEPVPPIADSEVAKMLRHCSRVIADMIRLQRLTGARPEEVCHLRGCDIEAGGDVWLYRPYRHKTEHHNKKRVIPLGKRAQRIVKRRLKLDTQAFIFTPADAMAEWIAESGQKAKTRVGGVYSTRSYRQAIHRACGRGKVVPWNPNQLRHTWATEVRKTFGLEAVQVGLGHSDIRTAEVYAERDIERAKEVAKKVG